ncbi:MAG TPA: GntR family transcriptional regulator [Paracoccaceae bacterium]|nr:GntR family transcriptional regulator [Paracoccaceae bacterium]
MTPKPLGIRRRYLHDEAADRLRELILSGQLAPNDRIHEIELAEAFGISRTPMREAIKILAAEGLLETLPNHGARVAQITQTEIEEMIEVIAGLEATAGELACRHITEDEVAAIERDHAAMLEAWERGDETGYFTRNRAIHDAIMAAARNGTLRSIYQSISGRIQRARYSAHKTEEQWRCAVEEHVRMIELLRERDGVGLGALLREHIRGKAEVIAAAHGLVAAAPAKAAGS